MEEEKRKKQEKIQIAFLVLLAIAICCLIVAIIIVVKNIEMFRENPIAFGIDKYEFDNCMCQQGTTFVQITEDGFQQNSNKVLEINLEEFNLGAKGSDGRFEGE